MADWPGKPKAWKRAAEIAEKKYGITVSGVWDLGQLNKKISEAAAKMVPKTDDKKDEKPAAGTTTTTPTKAEVVTLPASQKVDVQAPVMNVNVPAPHVTIHRGQFSMAAAWSWCQAFFIGGSVFKWVLPAVAAWVAG